MPLAGRATATAVAGVAVGLATLGGRFGRRAALRGVVSAGAAAAATRLPSAALTAFAAGAAQELPVAGVPLGIAAVANATAAGDRADASGALRGNAVAIAIAVATRKLWPVAPRSGAELTPRRTRADTEPAPDGEGLTVVVNASAGPGAAAAPVEALRAGLPAAKVVELEEGADLPAALADAARDSRALGVAGGDGSINTAAGVASAEGKPLLVVPAGTLNHFARDLGVTDVEEAIDAVRRGQAVAVDLAEIDGCCFLNTASFGSYVDLVDARERLEDSIGKWPALVVALVRVLRRSEPVEVEIDGRRRRIWMIFVGNCRYEPSGFAPTWRERLDDGLLDVRLLDGSSPLSRTRLLVAVLTGTLGRCGVYDHFTTDRFRVRSLHGPLRLARDGETFDGSTEFTVEKAGTLTVFAPHTD